MNQSPASRSYRLDRLRVRHMRLLEAVQNKGSLGGAARELGLSQPAVTMLLRELEQVFGAELVTRGARGAVLTDAGHNVLDRLTVALATLGHAMDAAESGAPAPVTRIGCVQVASFSALPQALAALEAAGRPGRLHIEEGEALGLIMRLSRGELDCVIGWMDEAVAASVDVRQLDIAPLGYGRMQVIAAAGHPLARKRAVPIANLAAASWVIHRQGSRTYAAYQRLFLQNGSVVPAPAVECPSIHTAIGIVAATRMLGIAPDRLIARYEAAGQIRRLKGEMLDLGRTHLSFFSLRQNARLEGVARLREALKGLKW